MSSFLLVGGPGNISTSTVDLLLDNGHSVAICTLPESPSLGYENRVRFYRGNRDTAGTLAKVVSDFRPDTVIDFCCFTPEQAEDVARAVSGTADRLVFVSTVDAYGYPGVHVPISEREPIKPGVNDYARKKQHCEVLLNGWVERTGLKLTICRPTYSFGNSFVLSYLNFGGGRYLIPRIRAGMPLVVPGDGTTLVHASPSCVTGKVIATIAMHPKSIGKSYTVGLADCYFTADDYYRMMGRVLGREPVLVHVPIDALNRLGRDDITWGPIYNLLRFNLAFDLEAFKRDFPDFVPDMTIDEWYRRYVEYHESIRSIPPLSEAFVDDAVVAAWERAMAHFKL